MTKLVETLADLRPMKVGRNLCDHHDLNIFDFMKKESV